eukprot:gene2587-biopygen2120
MVHRARLKIPKKNRGKSLEKNLSIRTGHRKFTEKKIEIAEGTVAQSAEVGATTKLKQLKVTLREELEVLKYLDEAVVELTDDDNEIFNNTSDAGAFRSKVHETILKIDESLGVNTTNTSQGSSQAPNKVTAVLSILPKIKLKKFSGEVTQWHSFWGSYKSVIHEEKSLNIITKFSYLRDLLEGNAASVIAGLSTTQANYVSAIELLQRRVGDKQVIISGHHDALLRITPLTSSKNIRDIRELYDKVEVHVRVLQSLDVPTSSYGSLLVPVLLSKIPEDVRLLIGREIKDDKWELGRLLNSLRYEVENSETCLGIKAALPTKYESFESKPANIYWNKSSLPTAATLFTESKETFTPSHTYCRESHSSRHSQVITDKKTRRQILRKQGRCFVCLRKNHIAKNCPSSGKCFNRNGRHNISICEGRQGETQDSTSKVYPSQSNVVTTNAKETGSLYVGTQNSVLLQTAQAFVYQLGSAEEVRARVVFNSGSQHSYVKEDLVQRVKLPTVGEETLNVKVFDSRAGEIRSYPIVDCMIASTDGGFSTPIRAHSSTEICDAIANQDIKKAVQSFEHLKGLKLADYNGGADASSISILVGADNLARFFTGSTKSKKKCIEMERIQQQLPAVQADASSICTD